MSPEAKKKHFYWQKIRGIQIQHNNVRIDNFINQNTGQPLSILEKAKL
jgi:hypothetical protein